MAYRASCHCGAVKVDVDAEPPTEAVACNCSHCRRQGFLLSFVPRDKVRVSGRDALTEYRFNKHVIAHLFCKTCGSQPVAEGPGKDGPMSMINLNCAPEIDLSSLKITHFDGASR